MPLHSVPTGFLWDRVAVQKPTAVSDNQGGQTRTYATVATFPGRLRESAGQQFSESEGRMISWNASAAWLDCRSDPTKSPVAGDRLVAATGKTYEVKSQAKLEYFVKCELKEIVV